MPNAGGWAYRTWTWSDWVGSSTAIPKLRLALRAAGEPELAADRRAVVLEMDGDRDPRPEPGMTAEQDARLHRRSPTAAAAGPATGPRAVKTSAIAASDPDAATSGQGVAWHERVTGHGHST